MYMFATVLRDRYIEEFLGDSDGLPDLPKMEIWEFTQTVGNL